MLTVGLTGGIACGKSEIAKFLSLKGAKIIDLDQVAREVVEPGTEAWSNIISFFGQDVLSQDGTLDRRKLGRIIFSDAEKRKKLNEITHSTIIQRVQFLKEKYFADSENRDKVLVIMAPLLIEAGMYNMVDRVIVVYCDEKIQKARLMERENIDEQEAERRIRSQMPLKEKLGYAHHVIDNSGSLEKTKKQVSELWDIITG